MGKADFPRPGNSAAPNHAGGGNGVVGCPEGPGLDEGFLCWQKTGNTVDSGHFQGFGKGEFRKDGWQPPGQHGFPGTGRPNHQNVINGFKHKRFYAIRSVLHGSLGIAPGGLGFPET